MCSILLLGASLAIDTSCRRSAAPIRINSGGPALEQAGHGNWRADAYYVGGVTYTSKHPISNTDAPELYQTARFGNSFRYSIPVPNGRATVRLMFAEIYFSGPGKRVFNVAINDNLVLTKYDPFADAGDSFRAVVKEFTVDVKNGTLKIEFTPIVEDPLVNAIEVVPGRT